MRRALQRQWIAWMLLALIGGVSSGCFRTPEEKYLELLAEGRRFFAGEEYRKALSSWLQAAEIRQDDWRLLGDIGSCQAKLGNYQGALKGYNDALKLEPKARPLWLDLARVLMVRGDLEDARGALAEAAALNPEDSLLLRLEGDLQLLVKRIPEAEDFYRRALALAPDDPLTLIRLAGCLAVGKERTAALRMLDQLHATVLDDPEVLINLAHFWRLYGDEAKAEHYFLAAVERRPQDIGLLMQLVEYYFQVQAWEQCEKYLERFSGFNPLESAIAKLRVELRLAQGRIEEAEALIRETKRKEPGDLELQLLEGKTLLLADRPTAAAGVLEGAVNNEPNLAIAHYLLGLAYLQGGNLKLAQGSLMRALSLRNRYSNAELLLAATFYKEGEYPIAAQYLTRLIEREGENTQAQVLLAAVHFAQGARQKALERLAVVNRLMPRSVVPVLFELEEEDGAGSARFGADRSETAYRELIGRYPQSIELLTRIAESAVQREALRALLLDHLREEVRRRRDDPFVAALLAELELAEGHPDRARTLLERALTLEPRMVSCYRTLLHGTNPEPAERAAIYRDWIKQVPGMSEPYIGLAQIRLEQGHPQEALAILEDACKRLPESAPLANNLAWLLLQTDGNVDRALALAQKAFNRWPEDPQVMDTLALAYLKSNLANRALWLLSEALSRRPGDPLLIFHQGVAYKIQGDVEMARASLQRSLHLGLGMPERLEAENHLAGLAPKAVAEPWLPAVEDSDDFKELPKSPLQW